MRTWKERDRKRFCQELAKEQVHLGLKSPSGDQLEDTEGTWWRGTGLDSDRPTGTVIDSGSSDSGGDLNKRNDLRGLGVQDESEKRSV